MNWQNCDSSPHSTEGFDNDAFQSSPPAKDICIENEQKNCLQLQKLKDPNKDQNRQAYIAIASKFGDWILNDNKDQDIRSILTTDLESFLFNFAEITPVRYSFNLTEFLDLYKDVRVIKREIKEANVDLDNTTAFQICYYEILNKKEDKIVSQFSIEVFSFRNEKINKYRACFGCSSSFDEYHHPFIPSRKDLMLAKVKELNYAWADQPDLDKIGSLLDDSTEYKVWRWHDQKAFTFYKSDFVANFRNLEEKYTIKRVVPYEVYSEGEFIMSNYVFYLDGKHELFGQKFVWLSRCIYKFDKDTNISKINQQGELHQEDEVVIPFKVYSKEVIKQKVFETNESQIEKSDLSLIDTNDVTFAFELNHFHPSNAKQIPADHIKGFNEFDKLSSAFEMRKHYLAWEKTVDFFVDLHDPSYDVSISVECRKLMPNHDNSRHSEMDWDMFVIEKLYIENGKVAKITIFAIEIPEPIPSPFDDKSFDAKNIKRE